MWLRRDLRLRDNVALAHASRASQSVVPVFVVDPAILHSERIGTPLVSSFFCALESLRTSLLERGSDLAVLYGDPVEELLALARRVDAQAIFFNVDYEPFASERDARASEVFERERMDVHACLDHVYFGADEIVRDDGGAYKVFTPYRHAWLRAMHASPRAAVLSLRLSPKKLASRDVVGKTRAVPSPRDFGYVPFEVPAMSEDAALRALDRFSANGGMQRYARERNVPAADATSHLSPHLRAGTIGIRTCLERAHACGGEVWANELIWREFYQMILARFPHVAQAPFIEKAARIEWREAPEEFEAWCRGKTGYPIVDAGMRQLNATGWMHNRLRMITASFLTKHLLIDWRYGERYFEQHLIDADLAQNNGGWQWSASTGTDAAPYFRIFNPVLQSKKFDPEGTFIRAMLPELQTMTDRNIHEPWRVKTPSAYPQPIVDHAFARRRALSVYAAAL